jgi:hypothetical protein
MSTRIRRSAPLPPPWSDSGGRTGRRAARRGHRAVPRTPPRRYRAPSPRSPGRLRAPADQLLTSLENRSSPRLLPPPPRPMPPSTRTPPSQPPTRGRSQPCRACPRACRHRGVRVRHGAMKSRLTMFLSHARIQLGRVCSVSGRGTRGPAAQAKPCTPRTKPTRRCETPTRWRTASDPPSKATLSPTEQPSRPVMEWLGRRHVRTKNRTRANRPMWARRSARGRETDQPPIDSWFHRRPMEVALPGWLMRTR